MKLNKKTLAKLIQESIKDKISKLREETEEQKKAKARAIVAILNDEAKTLDSLAKHAREMYQETQYSELEREANALSMMRDQKLTRIETIKQKYGLVDEKKTKAPK